MENKHESLMGCYFDEKDVAERFEVLRQLLCDMPAEAKDFFHKAFKKERHIDAKLCAVRGYAAYATEQEVAVLMNKLLELLKKIPENTPYDYSEYEVMRSVFLMPYLLKQYNYECFRIFDAQLQKQYDDMPDCFKGVFTLDEFGKSYCIRDPQEVGQSWDAFYGR